MISCKIFNLHRGKKKEKKKERSWGWGGVGWGGGSVVRGSGEEEKKERLELKKDAEAVVELRPDSGARQLCQLAERKAMQRQQTQVPGPNLPSPYRSQ